MGTTRDIRERVDLSKGTVIFAIILMVTIIIMYFTKAQEQTSAPTSQIEIVK